MIELFTPREPLSDQNQKIKKLIESTESVSVHVRRTDYQNFSWGCLTLKYYQEAINIIKEKTGKDISIFAFSDDPDFVEQNFHFCTNLHVVRNRPDAGFVDIDLMRSCKHNIIANSSFSWWGAYLNNNKDKCVIAPRSHNQNILDTNQDRYPANWLLIDGFSR